MCHFAIKENGVWYCRCGEEVGGGPSRRRGDIRCGDMDQTLTCGNEVNMGVSARNINFRAGPRPGNYAIEGVGGTVGAGFGPSRVERPVEDSVAKRQ